MKRLLVIVSIALLLFGQVLTLQKSDIFISGADDLIELHSYEDTYEL